MALYGLKVGGRYIRTQSFSVFYGDMNKQITARYIYSLLNASNMTLLYEPVHEISNNVVCATSKASDQPAHTRSLIRAFASPLSIL